MGNIRITSAIRVVAPCKDCGERFEACWGKCPKDERGEYGYRSWQADIKKVKESREAYKRLGRRKAWQRN